VEVDHAGGEAKCVGGDADQRGGEKFGRGVCGANSRDVVQLAERNPIVEGEEQHCESLQGEQRVKGVGMHAVIIRESFSFVLADAWLVCRLRGVQDFRQGNHGLCGLLLWWSCVIICAGGTDDALFV